MTTDKKIYFGKDKYIHFDKQEQEKDINNELNMLKIEMGLQPFQLFDKEFPELKEKTKIFAKIKEYNLKKFCVEHKIIYGDKNRCFLCESFNNKNEDYNEIVKSLYKSKYIIKDIILLLRYTFVGDVLGNIKIYRTYMTSNKPSKNLHPIKILDDHYKQIKYIDYNPRLNLLLSYSLDGFINLYTFPTCKLVRAIKVKDIIDSNEILKKVVLVSNPFPMIFTHDEKNMYVLSLNGELIKVKQIEKSKIDIIPNIDKNCGLVNDSIFIKDISEKQDKANDIQNIMKEYSLPSLDLCQ
jgi:WD40 repeat protein